MAFLGTDASVLQDITLVVLWVSGALNVTGVALGKLGRRRAHFYTMLCTTAAVLAFLMVYLLKVLQEGPTPFPGPPEVRARQYLPLVAVHGALAITTVALLTFIVATAVSDLQVIDGRRVLALDPAKDRYHHRFWPYFVGLWLATVVTGTLVYGHLFWWYG